MGFNKGHMEFTTLNLNEGERGSVGVAIKAPRLASSRADRPLSRGGLKEIGRA